MTSTDGAPGAHPFRRINWLLFLIPLASIGVAVIVSRVWVEPFRTLKDELETPAPFLVGAVTLIYAARSLATRNRLYILLAALALTFTLREIHFAWTHKGVYVMLACLGVWAGVWHKSLREPLRHWRHTSWMLATFFTYFLSQVIARRAFRFIPGESAIHIPLEEWVETTAHLMFLTTSIFGAWRAAADKPGAATKENSPAGDG